MTGEVVVKACGVHEMPNLVLKHGERLNRSSINLATSSEACEIWVTKAVLTDSTQQMVVTSGSRANDVWQAGKVVGARTTGTYTKLPYFK